MDKEMLDQLVSRDEKVFSTLVSQYSKLLWIVADSILSKSRNCTAEDVEECVSDVFMELWQYPQKYEPARGSLKNYLCLLVKSRALNTYRKKNRENVICLDEHSENFASEEVAALDTSDYSELHSAIKNLPEPAREILIRRYFFNEKPQVIADKMGLPKKEIENRLYRSKKALSNLLTDAEEVQL